MREFITPMLEMSLRDLLIHTVEMLDWEIDIVDNKHYFIYRNEQYCFEEMCVTGMLDLLYYLSREV